MTSENFRIVSSSGLVKVVWCDSLDWVGRGVAGPVIASSTLLLKTLS